MQKGFLFNPGEFESIFPFFIVINENMGIYSLGPSIKKLLKSTPISFTDTFELERPKLTELNFNSLKELSHQLIFLQIKPLNNLIYRGQVEFLSAENKILIIGSPWFNNSQDLKSSGLSLNDYPANNPMIDMLHVLKTQEIVNDELKELLEKSDRQKKELKDANKKIQKISKSFEETNQRYEFVNKATSDVIWDLDLKTNEMFHGDGFKTIFGYDSPANSNESSQWNKYIHPEDYERIENNFKDFIAFNMNYWTDEYRYLKSDGTYAIILDKAYVIRDEHGVAVRMVGAMQDITKKREEEEHLRLLESVIKHSNDGVMITEAAEGHKIVFINQAFTKVTGYSIEEVYGKNPRIFQGPKTDKSQFIEFKKAIKNWEPYELTVINYKKNGEEFWNNFSISPVMNEKGEYTHWISIEKDITEQKKANEELNTQKKFNEDILNNIPTDIAVFAPNHNYLFVNPHGIKNKEIREWIINKNDFDYVKMKGIDDGNARRRWELFEEAVETKEKVIWIDEHPRPDGKKNYILRNFFPYFENNKLKYVIGYGLDITERKEIEIKLNNALESVQKTNSELEQFAYVASHDLQEPLRMVTSFLSQLERKYSNTLDDKAKEYIYFAVDGAKRMRQIILDLLEFSRVGRTDENIKEVSIDSIVKEIILLHGKQIEELNALIKYDELPTLISHKTPIRQLFQNIIGNSLKYHRVGVPPVIEIKSHDKGEYFEFSISDNGIGIESEYHEKVFVIFQRLHNKDEYSGTGIGLAICRKIIEFLGGEIWITSVLNEGSTFCFTLPKKYLIKD
jgi:PAS domain S-box-containing protein